MLEYQIRVIEEKDELDNKRAKLDVFIEGDIFPKLDTKDQKLLVKQAVIMTEYAKVLDKRIQRFNANLED
jgi:hypothetical protein